MRGRPSQVIGLRSVEDFLCVGTRLAAKKSVVAVSGSCHGGKVGRAKLVALYGASRRKRSLVLRLWRP
jgi:hypothetical protein